MKESWRRRVALILGMIRVIMVAVAVVGGGYILLVLFSGQSLGWYWWKVTWPLAQMLSVLGVLYTLKVGIHYLSTRERPGARSWSRLGLLLGFAYVALYGFALVGYFLKFGGCNELGCEHEILLFLSAFPWSFIGEIMSVDIGPWFPWITIIFAAMNTFLLYRFGRFLSQRLLNKKV